MRDGSARYLHALRSFVEELTASTGVALSISKEDEDSVASTQKLPVFDASLAGGPSGDHGEPPPDALSVPLRLPSGEVCMLNAAGGGVNLEVVASVIERHLAVSHKHRADVDDLASQLLDAYEEINLFFDLASSFGVATDEAQLGQILLDRVLEATGGEDAALVLTIDESLELRAAKGDLSGSSGSQLLQDLPELERVLSRGISSNTSPEPSEDDRLGPRPTMITPVMLDGSPVGAVVVQKAASEPFLAGQLKITQSLSTQAGVFLNNLRQARRLVEADRISRELELAQTIQRQLLPAAEYDIEGLDLAAAYLATDRVGGDYYDVFQRSPSTVCALIADVSGHSVASGLMMTAARSAVRLIFEQTTRPSEILHRLNDALYGDLDQTGLFISMCIVVLDTDAKTAQYASAGHLPLLIYHDSSQEYEALDSTGLLLGIIPDARFDETVLSIARGDTAVLYTDGVTECRDSSGTFYGEERLRRLVADTAASDAQEIVRTVVSDLRAHTQGRLDDDVTLLVVKATSDW